MYWDLFWELSTERLVEGGPIPGSKIILYSDTFNIDYDDLKVVIRAMDRVFLEYIQEERDKTMKKSKKAKAPITGNNRSRRTKG